MLKKSLQKIRWWTLILSLDFQRKLHPTRLSPRRLQCYTELNELSKTQRIQEFEDNLIDRFGPLPESAVDLLECAKLKLKAAELRSGKGGAQNNRMIGYFIRIKKVPSTKDRPFKAS